MGIAGWAQSVFVVEKKKIASRAASLQAMDFLSECKILVTLVVKTRKSFQPLAFRKSIACKASFGKRGDRLFFEVKMR